MLRAIKRNKLVHIYIVLIFICSSLVCTLIEVLLYPIRFIHPLTFIRLNKYLCYWYWCLIPWAVQNWGEFQITIFGKEGVYKDFLANNHRSILSLMNHTGEIDWMIGWCVLEKTGLLGSTRTMIKDPVKYFPVLGWSFYFSDYIFVKRSAFEDLPYIKKICDLYKNYPTNFMMSIFPEGTRFTKEKYERGLEFARSKGLPEYKYHLLPRTKGFYLLANMMKENPDSKYIYDLQFAYRGEKASAVGVLNVDALMCDIYLERYSVAEIPSDEKECNEWLYNTFKRKDELMAYHDKNKCFPGTQLTSGYRKWPVIWATFWFTLFTSIVAFFALGEILRGNIYFIVGTIVLVPLANFLMNLLIRQTETRHASKYGLKNGSEIKKEN